MKRSTWAGSAEAAVLSFEFWVLRGSICCLVGVPRPIWREALSTGDFARVQVLH
jgi:hypothetical protein